MNGTMATELQPTRRAREVVGVARRRKLVRVLRELGVARPRPATREGAVEFRQALEELGTTFVKLGQLLSSRPDLLPDVYVEELTKLTDDAPPVDFAEIERVVREDVGDAVVELEPAPLAAASIAQTHAALLADGREVVVKVRRPGIVEQVDVDLRLVRSAVDFLEKRSETAQLLQLRALADELEVHLRAELDFVEEAHNAELIAEQLASYDDLVVPRVVHPYVTERLLVLERIHGRKLDADHGLPPERAEQLACDFFRAYIRQVTQAGVYHADPHRGNVLLTTDGRLALLDFGLLGRLDDETRTTLALLLLALAHNRSDDVAALLLSLSLTTLDSDEPAFVHELRRKLPRYHWRPLSGIRSGEALADLQRISLEHGVRLPPSFALVGKTLSQADSIARTLDPSLDPIALIEEESLELMLAEAESRLEPEQLFSLLFTQAGALSRLPRRLVQIADRLETGTLKVGIVPAELQGLEHILRSLANRLGMALIVVGLLIASALMAPVNHTVSLVGFVISGVLALYIVWRILRTPGEL
jgi:predicted unusual protein kinase regulating ubiquinone biosynthesis (AarF/ABC1/UbiB family)